MAISITFSEGSDRSRLVQHLGEGFLANKKLGNYKVAVPPWRLSVFCNPIELACALLDKESNRIAQTITVEEQKISVEKATADQLIDSSYPFGRDDDADVDTVDKRRLSAILEVGEVEWDDDERIRLNGKQVNSLSPGQRSSAMLPLVALAENAPLIIDQPEDNLDNKLVGKMMVDNSRLT